MGLFQSRLTPTQEINLAKSDLAALANALKRDAARWERRRATARVLSENAHDDGDTVLERRYLKSQMAAERFMVFYDREEQSLREKITSLDRNQTLTAVVGAQTRAGRAVGRMAQAVTFDEFKLSLQQYAQNIEKLKLQDELFSEAGEAASGSDAEELSDKVDEVMRERAALTDDDLLDGAPDMKALLASGGGGNKRATGIERR